MSFLQRRPVVPSSAAPHVSSSMRAEGDEASSGSRGASTGSTAKRSKRGPGEAFHEDGSSWASESELDVSQPKPAPRKDAVLPLNKLVRTLSLEVPDKPAAFAIAPPASAEPSTSALMRLS